MEFYFIASVFFILMLTCLIFSKMIFNDYFSPVGTFGGIWFFVLGMYHLRLYPYHPLEKFTWIYVLGGLGLFFVGCIVAIALNMQNRIIVKGEKPKQFINVKKIKKIIFIFYPIGVLGFIFVIGKVGFLHGFMALLSDPVSVHDSFNVRFLGYPYILNAITPVLAYIHFRMENQSRRLMLFIIFSCIVMLMASYSRTNIIRCIVWIGLIDSYLRLSHKSLKNIIIIAFIAVSFFASFQYVKNTNISESLKRSAFLGPSILRPLSPAYGYFTAPVPTFEAMIKDTKKFDYGTNTFNTMTRFVKIFFSDIKVRKISGKYYRNPIACNVYTYLDVYYQDFGAIGIILFSFIQGITVMFFYLRMVWHQKYQYFLLNGLFGWCLIISFFSNHFVKNTSIFMFVVAILVGRFVIDKPKALSS